MEEKKKMKITKEDSIWLAGILLFAFIMCGGLLKIHFASDTFNLMDLGYFEYPNQFFLKDARIVSSIVLYIAGFLKMDYGIYIILMEAIAIFLAGVSVYLIFQTVVKRLNITEKKYKVGIVIAAFLVVFNYMSMEYFLYAESAVMCLSVLLTVLAAIMITGGEKCSYLKALLLIILATYCYQGSVNLLVPLAFLFAIINQENTKGLVKNVIFTISILAISFLVNALSIVIINQTLGETQQRLSTSFFEINIISVILETIHLSFTLLWNPFFLIVKGGSFLVVVLSTILFLDWKDGKVKQILIYWIMVILALVCCVGPIYLMKEAKISARICMGMGAIIGLSLLYLITYAKNKPFGKIKEKVLTILLIVCFLYNTLNYMEAINAHIATNLLDDNVGESISNKIKEYEETTGQEVKKVAITSDTNKRDTYLGIKPYSSLTQRAFANGFCNVEALNYYCDKKLERVPINEQMGIHIFGGKSWDSYSDEQIVFVGDTLYLCVF